MYKNADVQRTLTSVDGRLARIETTLAALMAEDFGAAQVALAASAPRTVAATSTLTLPERRESTPSKAPKTSCSLHPEHKPFTVNGLAFHRTHCAGEDVAVA